MIASLHTVDVRGWQILRKFVELVVGHDEIIFAMKKMDLACAFFESRSGMNSKTPVLFGTVVIPSRDEHELANGRLERMTLKVFREKHRTQAVADQPHVITKKRQDPLKPNGPLIELRICAIWH